MRGPAATQATVAMINLPRLDGSKIQKIWDEDLENVRIECRYGQLSSTDGQSDKKHKTKQNKNHFVNFTGATW